MSSDTSRKSSHVSRGSRGSHRSSNRSHRSSSHRSSNHVSKALSNPSHSHSHSSHSSRGSKETTDITLTIYDDKQPKRTFSTDIMRAPFVLNTDKLISIPFYDHNDHDDDDDDMKFSDEMSGKDFIKYFIMLDDEPYEGVTNKIHIYSLSPEDRAFFEDPALVLPRTVAITSDIQLAREPITARTYVIKDALGNKTCEEKIIVPSRHGNTYKFDSDVVKSQLKEHIADCLHPKSSAQKIHIAAINKMHKEDPNLFELHFTLKVTPNDAVAPTRFTVEHRGFTKKNRKAHAHRRGGGRRGRKSKRRV